MDKSTVLIGLTLFTLLVGLAIAAYQLWSADKAQEQNEHSALAKRFGGKTRKPASDNTNDPNPRVPAFDKTHDPRNDRGLEPTPLLQNRS